MLMPKRVKRRRVFRGRMKGKAQRGNFLAYGEFGLMATEPSWVTARQIEAARVALTRYTKRGGQVWIKIFPDKPITESSRAVCCLRSRVLPKRMPARHCVLPLTSCPASRRSLPVSR